MSILLVSCKNSNPMHDTPISIVNYDYDTEQLIKHIEQLSSDDFKGRRTGTEASIKAQDYIIKQLATNHVMPLDSSYRQEFDFILDQHYSATNIIGYVPGTANHNQYIVLSAHYDHLGMQGDTIYNGADDNASGVAALLAFAQYFKTNPPRHHVIIAAFDAEELEIKGAEYFVNDSITKSKNLVLNINMDMISRSVTNQLYAVGTRYTPSLKPLVNNVKPIGKVMLTPGHEGLTPGTDWTYSGDHAAFYRAGIPFIYFGVDDHKDYHLPSDTFDQIDQVFYKDAVQTILQVFNQIDQQ